MSENNHTISIVTVRWNCLQPSQKVKVFNWNSVIGTNSARRLAKWAKSELVLWETSVIERGKLQHREQSDPEASLMIVVGSEGMHTGFNHMHSRPQPNKLQEAHTYSHWTGGRQGKKGRISWKVGYLKKKIKKKKPEAVKQEAARTLRPREKSPGISCCCWSGSTL